MAHSNSTQYYNLPQFESTDKPAWLVDVNPAYAAIDAGIHAAKAAADAAQGDATQALSDASAAGTTASGADAKAAGSIASLADTFDSTATYDVGDLVIYNSLLYICIVAVTVPGAWTGSGNWNRTTLEAEINKKQDTIDRLTSVSTLNGTDKIAIYDGTNTKCATAEELAAVDYYKPGDVISIKGGIGCGQLGWGHIIFFIPLNKPISSDVNSISIDLSLTVFGVRDDANVTVIASQPVTLHAFSISPTGIGIEVINPNSTNYDSGLCWIKVTNDGKITLNHST